MRDIKHLYGIEYLQTSENYEFYKKTFNTKEKHKITNKETWKKVHAEIWKVVSEFIVEYEAGVYLPRMGYMVMVKRYLPHVVKRRNKKYFNDHSENRVYFLTLFNDVVRCSKFRYWGMDRALKPPVKRALRDSIRSGKKYKLLYSVVKKLYKRQNTSIKGKDVFRNTTNGD